MKQVRILLVLLLLFNGFGLLAQGIEKYMPARPNPPRLVNDFLDILTPAQEEALEKKLVAYDDSTSNQVAVVTIGDIGDYDVVEFAAELGRKWGVGGKDYNNGVVLLILIDKQRNKRKVAIATGYGLEGALPDYTTKEIIETEILPNFKASDIYRGLDEGTDAIIKAAEGTYKAPANYNKRKKSGGGNIVVAVIIFIVIMIILSNINRRGGGGMVSRRGYRRWNDTPPIWWFPSGGGGGGWGGGGGGGGGFGGFGGGSFGGGGSSGSW
jgi:uncharacterized protein